MKSDSSHQLICWSSPKMQDVIPAIFQIERKPSRIQLVCDWNCQGDDWAIHKPVKNETQIITNIILIVKITENIRKLKMGEKIQKYVDFRANIKRVTTEPTKKQFLLGFFS